MKLGQKLLMLKLNLLNLKIVAIVLLSEASCRHRMQ